MATFDSQQGWLPVENSRDCYQGFCTIYCPQWCYVLFPSPPPLSLNSNFNNFTTGFWPLVIAIIGCLATFFLLVTYYTLVTKFCCSFRFHRNHSHHRSNPNLEEEESESENYHQESWHLPPSNGLDEEVIRKISVYRYKKGEGLVEGTDCSVCLVEFREDESLRLLPKCSHAFHLQCIDTWLNSHSNCPLCRADILLPSLAFEVDSRNRAASDVDHEQEVVVVVVEDIDLPRIEDEENEVESEGNMAKCFEVMEIGDEYNGLLRRSLSLGLTPLGRIPIAEMVKITEEESMVAKDHHRLVSAGSSRRGRGKRWKARSGRSRGLHSVMSPVRMKRSVSSDRSWFARKGRGKALLLPAWGRTYKFCWV